MIPLSSSAQDLRVGGNVGFFLSEINPMDAFDIAATIDFIPHKSILYLETGPQLTITPNSTIFTAPLYLGFIIGSTATIEPGFGGYLRSNANYGYVLGISAGYYIQKTNQIYLRALYAREHYKRESPRGFDYLLVSNVWMIRIGYKRKFTFKKTQL